MPVHASTPVVMRLSRGGTLVQTSTGPVQLGAAPPESIKDALAAGLEVPSIYVLPTAWFSRRSGLTVAELEFPVYYNFFQKGRRLTAVCDSEGKRRLSMVLRESLFGPEHVDTAFDYAPRVSLDMRADLGKEMDWFRRKGGGRCVERVEDVVDFVLYDERGRARLGGGVEVARTVLTQGQSSWQVVDGGRLLAEVAEEVENAPERGQPGPVVSGVFQPPAFGLTVLGSSHGFDPAGKTTGFVLWVNHHGVLVDPPCDATETLRLAGVSPRQVDAVILTHCHADHDAGVFQKILEAGRVSLHTTPTILESFLRKYTALTGETEEQLRRLFVFRPVTLGAPQRIQGAEFRFFYSLHAIPTVGFECYLGGKSFVYSADTMYDPPRIEAMHAQGFLSRGRRDSLLHFPWHHSVILHEAGVPPIHTPADRLAQLPTNIKERLRIIHIAEVDLPKGQGLRLARTGFENTIVLPVAESRHAAALEALDALVGIELFRDLPVARAREFLTISRRESYLAGTLIIGQGEPGDSFYIILSGEAAVVRDGVVIKVYRDGDFFGETALVTGEPRSADVRAKTDLAVLAVDKYDFLSFLRDTDLVQALVRLARNRDLPSWDLMAENHVLSALSAAQKTQLQALLQAVVVKDGEILWEEGGCADSAWLLDTAVADFHEGGRVVATLGRGSLVGDIEGIIHGRPPLTRAVIRQEGMAFRIPAAAFSTFLHNNPGVLLALGRSQYVEGSTGASSG
ncbi:MAG: cAMP/cGMP-dependent 3',5'-cyclic-AMP/GMP phosphodiesterase [Deltaproteobacteria bacterium]|nr:cAMP/cGMP-dependent 3',5'-cyclic-AMP/GMP phosphodiesterase [Deltaproteobacteria bacterium]